MLTRVHRKTSSGETVGSVEGGSSGYTARLDRALSRGDDLVARIGRGGYGVDITGHRPEHLLTVDMFLGESFRRDVTQNKKRYVNAIYSVGGYLGEVFVRNLGGFWHFPDALQTLLLFVSLNPAIRAERYFYVVVGGQKVHVFAAAREGIDRTSKEFSLSEFYQGWARYLKAKPFPPNIR